MAEHLKSENSKSCGGCSIRSQYNHHQWKGFGEISSSFWTSIKRGAAGNKGRRTIMPFEITIEYAWEICLKQNKKCILTGLDLVFAFRNQRYGRDKSNIHTASLDRIDSSKGYIENNVQWVHKDINMMKRTYDQEYYIKMFKLVALKNNS